MSIRFLRYIADSSPSAKRNPIPGLRHGARVAELIYKDLSELVCVLFAEVICEVLSGAADGDCRELVVGDADIVPAHPALLDRLAVATAPAVLAVLSHVVALEYLYLYFPFGHVPTIKL